MARRLDGIRRILGVEQQMRRIAEARLAALARREAEIGETQAALIGSLNAETPLHGLVVGAMATHLRRSAAEAEAVGAEKAAQARVVSERYGREKRAERLAERIARDEAAEAEKRQLDEILERIAGASLP